MADTSFVVESEWICNIRSGLEMARSGQNAGGDIPIKRLPGFFRKPVELYTPRQWQFGLHNRDLQTSSSESEVTKISLAAAFNLNQDEWDKFCADVVDNPADMKLKSYGIYFTVTEQSLKEVQYLLTLDALTLVLVISSNARAIHQRYQKSNVVDQRLLLPDLFIRSLVTGGFNIEAVTNVAVCISTIWDDLFLCENQIPMALMRKVSSKCYGLLPVERKSNDQNLRELDNLNSDVTKKLLDSILKNVTTHMCHRLFAEPCPNKKDNLINLIDLNYEVGELENCAHIFACIHKVITSCVSMPPIATVTTTFERAKQLFWRPVATGSEKLATIIATIFGFSRKTETEVGFGIESLPSATVLKKAGIRIQGIPGMVQQVAFKNGCLFLPIMKHNTPLESYICNMVMYEGQNSWAHPFFDYLQLMKHLIKTPEDVSYLIDCDVIRPGFSTQKRIFQMWQSIRVYYYPRYSMEYSESIVQPINKHLSPLNMMVTDFYNTYCSKPWLVISVMAGIILLVATLIQTYVAVIGSDKMQPHFPRGG